MRATLLKLYDKHRNLLFVTKSTNLQSISGKDWWWEVNHIITKHFDTIDDMESERYDTIHSGEAKYNENKPKGFIQL